MKKSLIRNIVITNVWLAVAAFAFPVPNAFAQPIASVQQIQGDVSINKSGSAVDLWNPITQNTDIETGDSIKTTNGSCDLIYTDQAKIHLNENTSITVHEEADSQNIMLILGNLKAEVDKKKAVKPFQVVTPTAVGAIRGTNVDFDFNDQGQLTVDLKDGGPVQVFNDEAQMNLNLTDGKKIAVNYDRQTGILKIKNDCGSNGKVEFNVLGTDYAESPCDEKEINLETASGEPGTPNTPTNDKPENPDDFASPSPSPLDDVR